MIGEDMVAPMVASGQVLSTPENRAEGALIVRVIATDDVGVATFSIDGGDPGGFFAIDETGWVTLTAAGAAGAANDFETGANVFVLEVTATDAAGNVMTEDVTISVTDVAPAATRAFAVRADGTLSGDLGADDASASGPLGFAAVDGEIVVLGAEIAMASGALLTINADLTFDYDPNGAFESLGGAAQASDSFSYTRYVGGASLSFSELDGTNGFRLDGIDDRNDDDIDLFNRGDRSGGSVASAGDVNGDGIDDLIVGASDADPNGNGRAGESYVVFGSRSGFSSSLSLAALDGTNGFRLDGIDEGDRSGSSVASAGDLNGDGVDDLIVGAPFAAEDESSFDSRGSGGESYVVFGRTSGFAPSLSLAALDGTDGFRLELDRPWGNSGWSVASAGDVNGDGIADVIVGAPRSETSYVMFGSMSGFSSSLSLSALDGTTGFRLVGISNGTDGGSNTGRSVSSAGDVNGDGIDDLAIGALTASPGSDRYSYAGESYVVFGSRSGFASTLSLADLDGTDGFRLPGVDDFDGSGRSVASAGDVNGDGFGDLIIGAAGAGESYVVFGRTSGFPSDLSLAALDGTDGFRLDGIDERDGSGYSVASAGDVNGDGLDDLIVGASGADPDGRSYAGESYVVFGRASGFAASLSLSALDGRNGFRLDGIDARDSSGRSVASAGDVNGDGFNDLIVGAPGAADYAGESYVVFGRPDFTTDPAAVTVTITGTDDPAVVTGGFTGAVTEGDAGDVATAIGTLAISDVDEGDAPSFADQGPTEGEGGYGRFVLTAGTWTYTLDQDAVQDLDPGDRVTDRTTFTATDGTAQAVTVTITGTDDPAVVTGGFTGAVTEGDAGDVATAIGTLAISDVDEGDAPSFADQGPTEGEGGYGRFVLTAGTWTYTLDQDAVQDLDPGDRVTDRTTFTATDGTAQAVTVTITGTDDPAVVTGGFTGAVTEGDAGDVATAIGTLAISDVDEGDAPSFADQGPTEGEGGYGRFVLTAGTWTYTLDQDAVQDLDPGDRVTDRTTFTATDGTAQAVTVTITGTDDPAVVTGGFTGAVTEGDAGDVATAIGTLAISDVDEGDAPSFADQGPTEGEGGYGRFVLTAGTWTYTLDQDAVQDLDPGDRVTDRTTFTATDGTAQAVTVTITGTDDPAVVTGGFTGAVTEGDAGDVATAIGTLAISDVDEGDAPSFADQGPTEGEGGYGRFVLTAGTWTYTLDQDAVQDLDPGDRVTDRTTFTATDGTAQAVTVTITGTDDPAVVTGGFTGAVTEGDAGDVATAIGTLAISDVDEGDAPSFADQGPTEGEGGYGRFVLTAGTWTYTLDQDAVQDLDPGDRVTDRTTFTATDGTAQAVTVTITGTDDPAVVTGGFTGAVTEGDAGDVATAIGTLAISDVDEGDAPSFADQGPTEGEGGYGRFVLTAGTWTYTLDQDAVQDLDPGDRVTDRTTFTATDGTAQAVTVTITGTDEPTPEPGPEPETIVVDGGRFDFAGQPFDRAIAAEGAGRVRIFGDERDQEMVGGEASDVLVSGGGADVMTGGRGGDVFAFQRTDPLPDATITDFDAADSIALDDRFFGLGDAGIDLRQATPDQVLLGLRLGLIDYDFDTRELSVPRNGPGSDLVAIATFAAAPPIGLDDLFLF